MARTDYTVSHPGFIADPASIAKNTGRQVNWGAVPASSDYQDENDDKRLLPGTIVSLKNGGIFPRTESELNITTLTQDTDTATATTENDHGLATGDKVTISGADPDDYNGTHQVTVTGDKTFTFALGGSPADDTSSAAVAISPSVGLLATFAGEKSRTDAKTGYGVIVGGVVYGNLLPDHGDDDIEDFKEELQDAGTGFAFETHSNDAAS